MTEKTIVYIGRFAPFHNGHKHVIDTILAHQPKRLIIIVGSANQAPCFDTPFTAQERMSMIAHSVSGPILFGMQQDWPYRDALWAQSILDTVYALEPDDSKIQLVVSHDEWYADLLPWDKLFIPPNLPVRATKVREYLFEDRKYDHLVPAPVAGFLDFWKGYNDARFEYETVKDYRRRNDKNQYPAAIHCADPVVFCEDRVLLVVRGPKSLGRGLLALPGGHVEATETAFRAAVRECREETGVILGQDGYLYSQTFSHPKRDPRGRCLSEAHVWSFEGPLPDLKAGDDAASAIWWKVTELNPERMYQDHWHIINEVLYS